MPAQLAIPLASFSVTLLPEGARTPGTTEFKDAVIRHISLDYAQRHLTALVTVDTENIYVTEFASVDEALHYVLPMLKAGQLRQALPLLESLTKGHPADAHVLYNLGLAYSEMQQYDEAIIRLKRCVRLQPRMTHAWVGIGTAYERMEKLQLAREAFEKAVSIAPKDGYAQRNLGALLGRLERPREALPHFRKAYTALPDDMQTLYGLAVTLHQMTEPGLEEEGDRLFVTFISKYPDHPLAEEARTMRTAFAHKRMRGKSMDGMRPDVMFYLMGALQKFAEKGDAWRQAVTFEIALLGRTGLDINDSAEKYVLKQLPGKFSGLHLLAIMYAGFKLMDPKVDPGVDFSQEYAMAVALRNKPSPEQTP